MYDPESKKTEEEVNTDGTPSVESNPFVDDKPVRKIKIEKPKAYDGTMVEKPESRGKIYGSI